MVVMEVRELEQPTLIYDAWELRCLESMSSTVDEFSKGTERSVDSIETLMSGHNNMHILLRQNITVRAIGWKISKRYSISFPVSLFIVLFEFSNIYGGIILPVDISNDILGLL